MREVVVTGIGLSTPHGARAATWKRCLSLRVARAGAVSGNGRALNPAGALQEALDDAALLPEECVVTPIVIGSSKGGVSRIGDPRLNGGFWREVPPGATAVEVVRQAGLGGPVRTITAACASGALAVMLAAQSVAYGETDVVIAGGIEQELSPLLLAGYAKLGVLAVDGVCRPFDRRRSGFVPSAGAGFIVLESAERAATRGARVYATLAGWAAGSDTSDPIAFDGTGDAVSRVARAALERAGMRPEDLGYINAHGTGTRRNDTMEAAGLRAALGPAAGQVPVSSTKGTTGHLLGAAGVVEWGITLLALSEGRIPHTAGLEDPEPGSGLDLVMGSPREFDGRRRAALSLSFGFGGAVVALVAVRKSIG